MPPIVVSTLYYVYLLGLPIVGAAIAITSALRSYEAVNQAKMTSGVSNRNPRRLILFMIPPIFLVMLGVSLWLLSNARVTDALTSLVSESAAMAYGVPSLLSGIGMGIVFWNGVGKALRDNRLFSRVLVYIMYPLTAAIFGLVISFLIISRLAPFNAAPIPHFSVLTVESARSAAIYISIGGAGAPLSAILSTSYRDAWRAAGMGHAIIRGTVGESVCIILLLLAFFSANV